MREDHEDLKDRSRLANRYQRAMTPDDKVTAPVTKPRRLLSLLTPEQRKMHPITSGVLDYFPDAIALVALTSYKGNEQHNKGQPLHWARGKSMDHEDALLRHTIERDTIDHAAARAWRALAALQEMAEKEFHLDPPRGAKNVRPVE